MRTKVARHPQTIPRIPAWINAFLSDTYQVILGGCRFGMIPAGNLDLEPLDIDVSPLDNPDLMRINKSHLAVSEKPCSFGTTCIGRMNSERPHPGDWCAILPPVQPQ
ncbi:MAG: hypothetical protein GVY36_01170 [Verrucomicrobia bacterium]|nr:hypothetical protein [Verrucomicrobiota bacterium]